MPVPWAPCIHLGGEAVLPSMGGGKVSAEPGKFQSWAPKLVTSACVTDRSQMLRPSNFIGESQLPSPTPEYDKNQVEILGTLAFA